MSLEEILELMRRVREICEKESNASEDLIDGINLGKFPKDPNLMVIISIKRMLSM